MWTWKVLLKCSNKLSYKTWEKLLFLISIKALRGKNDSSKIRWKIFTLYIQVNEC